MTEMQNVEIWTGNQAVAQGVMRSRPQVVAAYPITPSTAIIQDISDMVQDGRIKGQFIAVESEHAAMAGCVGASVAGSRAFTATASQGLLYMMEMVYIAGYTRLPMTMAVVNRAVFGGWSIWLDHQDLYSMRDAGWIQLAAKNNQEVHDLIPQSYKVSEHHDVYMPSAVNLDGFVLSHVAGRVEPMDQKLVDDFLPPFNPMLNLDPSDPFSFGALTLPDDYNALRKDHHESMERAKTHLRKVTAEFTETFGRDWGGLVEIYGPEDADVGIISIGTIAEETEVAVDRLNMMGKGSFGATRIRAFRPFPVEEILDAAKRYDKIIVIDRGYSMGSDPPLVSEIRNVLYKARNDTPVLSMQIGLGGEEVPHTNIERRVLEVMQEDM